MNEPRFRCVIMGAAGRDFHDFLSFFRDRPEMQVVAFTAAQIPGIAGRSFPKSLAGPGYREDIPIVPETELADLVRRQNIDFVFLAYSDLPHSEVMHKASIAQAAGASFALLGPRHTELPTTKPVISVTAVRTGAGKSPLSQTIADHLRGQGRKVAVVRHPMPYGDLRRQVAQRLATPADLDRADCTVEEREEYLPYVERGLVVYAGVDYTQVLTLAERENDILLWDGGNNDRCFFRAGLKIVVLDALRAGHETDYYPGETNLRSADILVINKVGTASLLDLDRVRASALSHNPRAVVLESDLEVTADDPSAIHGRRVLVIEDGPTLTHGGMAFGAGVLAARKHEAGEILDPRPCAVGSIAEAYRAYPHLHRVLPALGYSAQQLLDLAATITRVAPEVVIDASPARVGRLLQLTVPVVRVTYRFVQKRGPSVFELVDRYLGPKTS